MKTHTHTQNRNIQYYYLFKYYILYNIKILYNARAKDSKVHLYFVQAFGFN